LTKYRAPPSELLKLGVKLPLLSVTDHEMMLLESRGPVTPSVTIVYVAENVPTV